MNTVIEMKKKVYYVIMYHKVDLDGITSAHLAELYFRNNIKDDDDVEIVGLPYNRSDGDMYEVLKHYTEGLNVHCLCIVDLSISISTLKKLPGNYTVYIADHHASSMEAFNYWKEHKFNNIRFLLNVERAATNIVFNALKCGDWVDTDEDIAVGIERVHGLSPTILSAIAAADIGKATPRQLARAEYLKQFDLSVDECSGIIQMLYCDGVEADEAYNKGKTILEYKASDMIYQIKRYGYIVDVDDEPILMLNTPVKGQFMFQDEILVSAGLNPDTVKTRIRYTYDGKVYSFTVSSKDPNFDCNEFARRFGGGGHKFVAGFSAETIPEELTNIEII